MAEYHLRSRIEGGDRVEEWNHWHLELLMEQFSGSAWSSYVHILTSPSYCIPTIAHCPPSPFIGRRILSTIIDYPPSPSPSLSAQCQPSSHTTKCLTPPTLLCYNNTARNPFRPNSPTAPWPSLKPKLIGSKPTSAPSSCFASREVVIVSMQQYQHHHPR